MNILFLTRLYYPHPGGVEKHLQKITQLLQSEHQITIITEQYDRKLKTEEEIKGVKVLRIPTWNVDEKSKKWRLWQWLWKNRSILREADIIHIHDVFFWFLPFRLLFPRKKVFITFHGYETKFPIALSAIIQRRVASWLTAGNISVGDFISKWYGIKPTYVTYGAADSQCITRPGRVTEKKTYKILIAGRMEQDTGMLVYFDAAKRLKSNFRRNISFDIVGDGSLKNKFEDIGSTYGFVKDLSKYLNSCDFVFASSYLIILEAMLAKKIVFAVYDHPLKKDYLETHPAARNMVIVDSSTELVNKFNQLIDSPQQIKHKTAKAFSWAKTQTWEKLADVYLKLWHS